MAGTLRIAREALLWTGGVLGSLCLLSLLAGWALNVTPLVFSSGSMSPAYDAGALGIAREVPASELAVGDVVSVLDARGDRVTHRVVGVATEGDTAVLSLRGDANDVADAPAYRVATADRVVAGVPYAGYALNAAASPAGLAVTALLVAGVLLVGFGRGHRLVPVGMVSTLALGVGLGASGVAPWAFTSAYWTDSASATVAATTPAALSHQQPTCTSSETNPRQQADLAWPALGPQYEYFWELYRNGVAAPIASATIGPASPPTVIHLTFGIVSGGGQNDNYTAVVQTRLVSNHSNVGPATTTPLHSGPRPNGPNWWMYCGAK